MFQMQAGDLVATALALVPACALAAALVAMRRPAGMAGAGAGAWAVAAIALALAGGALVAPASLTGIAFDRQRELVADGALLAVLMGLGAGFRRFNGARVRGGLRMFAWLLAVAMAAGFALGGVPHVALLVLQLAGCFAASGAMFPALRLGRAQPVPAGKGVSSLLTCLAILCLALCMIQVGVLLDAIRFDVSAWLYPSAFARPQGAGAVIRLLLGIAAGTALLASTTLVSARAAWLRERAAALDPQTGIPLREGFAALLDEVGADADKRREPLVVATVSLDHFDAIEKVYGASGAERVLRHFSGMVRRMIRPQDFAGRVKPDTFAIGMPATPVDEARALTIRLSTAVRAAPCPSEPDAIHYTVTVDLHSRTTGEPGSALLQRVEAAGQEEAGDGAQAPGEAQPARKPSVRGAGIVLPARPEPT